MNVSLIQAVVATAIFFAFVACVPHYLVGTGLNVGDDKMVKTSVSRIHVSQELQLTRGKNKNVGFSLCPTCIDFAEQALDILLNAVLQIGVIGTCGDICNIVQEKTGSQILGVVCNLLCDIAGVEEFVKIIENADLDPIYYCELLKFCPIKDNGDAKITSLTVSPPKGPQGTFTVDLKYTSVNGTGTGEIVIAIKTVDNVPLEDGFLILPQNPGNYDTRISIKAEPDPDCDPTQGPCEAWLPGNYVVKILICNGECGSKHPHSQIYDTGLTNFTITN